MAGSQVERHRLLDLSRKAQSDDAALGQLTQWILNAKSIELSEAVDDRIWEGALNHACQLAGRFREKLPLETLDNFDASTGKKLKTLAKAACTDEQALKELARAFYILTTGQKETPSLKKVKDVPAWLSSLQNARKLAKMSQDSVSNWLKSQYPKISQTKRLGFLELAGHAAESPKAQQLLAVELYRLFEAGTPIKIPAGYYETSTVQFAELAHRWVGQMRSLKAETELISNHISALEKRLP